MVKAVDSHAKKIEEIKEGARAFIVGELGRHGDRNDLIAALSRRYDIDWKDAKNVVESVELYDGENIVRRQSPLLAILGLGVIVIGLALTADAFMYFWRLTQMDETEQLIHSSYIYVMGGSMVTGLAMITGGIIGFRKIFGAYV